MTPGRPEPKLRWRRGRSHFVLPTERVAEAAPASKGREPSPPRARGLLRARPPAGRRWSRSGCGGGVGSRRRLAALAGAPFSLPAEAAVFGLRSGETHVPVHCTFINLMKLPNEGTLIVLVPASNHFMF